MAKKIDTKKVRGTATYYDNGDMDFTAYKEGQPSQEVIKKSKNGKLYKTTSKDKPKLCAYLSCDADAPDATAQLEDQLSDFLKGFGGKVSSEKPTQKDRVMWDDDGVRVWYDAKNKAVQVDGLGKFQPRVNVRKDRVDVSVLFTPSVNGFLRRIKREKVVELQDDWDPFPQGVPITTEESLRRKNLLNKIDED
jgi:hypothetical protein